MARRMDIEAPVYAFAGYYVLRERNRFEMMTHQVCARLTIKNGRCRLVTSLVRANRSPGRGPRPDGPGAIDSAPAGTPRSRLRAPASRKPKSRAHRSRGG